MNFCSRPFFPELGEEHIYAVNSYDLRFTKCYAPQVQRGIFSTLRVSCRASGIPLTEQVIFFGGGSIIKEPYASVGRNPYSTLLMILATVTFAKQIARKVVMSNIGVGPLFVLLPAEKCLLVGFSTRWIFSVRDEKSHRTMLKLGLSPLKVNLVPDAVFANPPEVFVPNPKPLPPSDKIRIALT